MRKLVRMSTYQTPNEAARHAIRLLGGPSRAARLLKVKGDRHQTVQSWLRTRVPAEYCPDIEAETRERGAPVLCEQLRPDVGWTRIRGHLLPAGGGEGPASADAHDDVQGREPVRRDDLAAETAALCP